MKRLLLSLVIVGLVSGLLANFAVAAPGGVTDSDTLKALAEVRQATARYHDVDAALADGYVPVGPCVEVPGLGGMGIHYVNFGLAADGAVDPLAPEILLYVPQGKGMKLVGVEYFVAIGPPGAPVPPDPPPAPIVLGQEMGGPFPGHGPGDPPHYDLHVWLWQGNPDGIFEEFNPNVRCP